MESLESIKSEVWSFAFRPLSLYPSFFSVLIPELILSEEFVCVVYFWSAKLVYTISTIDNIDRNNFAIWINWPFKGCMGSKEQRRGQLSSPHYLALSLSHGAISWGSIPETGRDAQPSTPAAFFFKILPQHMLLLYRGGDVHQPQTPSWNVVTSVEGYSPHHCSVCVAVSLWSAIITHEV